VRPATPTQREILIQLHCGWHYGADERSLRGLRTRGLVEMRPHSFFCSIREEVVSFDLPWLTPAGVPIAAECWLALPVAEKRAWAKERMDNWGLPLGAHIPAERRR
jgi:hypothetical protein